MALYKVSGEDNMAVYENTRRCPQGIFEVLKIDMNKFKSIWGLMLRIYLLSVNRPGGPSSPSTMLKPMKIQKMALY